jgi:YidC/Oxa1 family membrane protein insertase
MSTEKRLFLFLVLTFMVLAGYSVLMEMFGPKRPVADAIQKEEEAKKKEAAKQVATDDKDKSDEATKKKTPEQPAVEKPAVDAPPAEAAAQVPANPHLVITLGSYEPPIGSGPLLVTLNSLGGALERVELVGRNANGSLRYRDLDNTTGYLGSLALTTEPGGGCRIHSVAPGTPAAKALPDETGVGVGLQPNDVLTRVNDIRIVHPDDLDAALQPLKSDDRIKLNVERVVAGQTKTLTFSATLDVRPFQLVKPEALHKDETRLHPPSLLLSIRDTKNEKLDFLDRLHHVEWATTILDKPVAGVEFRYQINAAAARDFGLAGPTEVIKRYWMGATTPGADPSAVLPAYHMDFEVEVRNLAAEPQSISFRLDGTNGLPTEGWWYLTKIHPRWFQSAGARDVVLRTDLDGHRLIGCSSILSPYTKDEKLPQTPLFSEKEPVGSRSMSYIGIDTQYFAAALVPSSPGGARAEFARAEALVWGEPKKVPKGWERTANASYQLTSNPLEVLPEASAVQRFRLFLGPKDPAVLAAYGLQDWIYYGWFGWIASFLSMILHFFYAIVGNYGIAIILLTVLVRSCMFPISRTAARNAAMMQELAPEMRKIAEKYKNNLEARGKAQQELFRAHNYNPLSGCWLMFLQLPVFVGLYRCLAIDIELRQAPLIPGLEWCSNLAGPDKLFYWKTDFLSYFTDESGWLGPYFNVLPIFTIILFLLHQKLFTPPATDEQTEMQMKMMKIMTVVMGVLFYKVPAGLCLYFITSSLWGIGERKLLPKPTPKKKADEGGAGGGGGRGGGGFDFAKLFKPKTPPPGGNGTDRKKELERKMRKK